MNEEIKVLPVEAEEFYKDRGDITDQDLLNFKPIDSEFSLSAQRQTIDTLNQQIRDLRTELKQYARDFTIWYPESWFLGPSDEQAELITISSALNKIQRKLALLDARLTKAGL